MGCPDAIRRALDGLAGVQAVLFEERTREFHVRFDGRVTEAQIERLVAALPYEGPSPFHVAWQGR